MFKNLERRFIHLSAPLKAVLIFIAFIIITLIIPLEKTSLNVSGILSAASIFYSILLGFYIAAAMSNLSRLKTLVATETGALIAIFHLVKLALPEKLEEVRESIDKYLIKRFDYEVDSYVEPTTKEFFLIFDVLKGVNGKSGGESSSIGYIAEAMYYIPQARRELSIVGAKVVDSASWVLLDVLSLVIVISLFLTRDGSLQSSLIVALLSASAILSLFILADVDANRFGEEQFAIDTYQDVFSAIGKQHYYPAHYLEVGRYTPPNKIYRTGNSNSVKLIEKK